MCVTPSNTSIVQSHISFPSQKQRIVYVVGGGNRYSYCGCVNQDRKGKGRSRVDLKPAVPAREPGPTGFQPNQPKTTFLAKISPNPSMTPFTKGSARLIARAESKATTRVFVDREGSKMARVEDGGAGLDSEVTGRVAGVEGSGRVEGNEDVDAWTSTQFCDPSPDSGSVSTAVDTA